MSRFILHVLGLALSLLILSSCSGDHIETRSRVIIYADSSGTLDLIEVLLVEQRRVSRKGEVQWVQLEAEAMNVSGYRLDADLDIEGYDWVRGIDSANWSSGARVVFGLVSQHPNAFSHGVDFIDYGTVPIISFKVEPQESLPLEAPTAIQ
ncbi:MAG: hypothetical protein EA402_13100 [Planctomycetota bacterium]|nr:MAG: hypothetical protein EA402_13100 [Planctomycetota bacterium]